MKDEDTITEHWDIAQGERKLVLRNLSKGQRTALKNGSIGIGGVLAGAGLFALFGPPELSAQGDPKGEAPTPDDTQEPVIMYTDACFAEGVNDDMSFSEAFRAARNEVGPGGFFEWHGNTYNTYLKEEWDQMSDTDRQEYYASVEKDTPPTTPDIAKTDTHIVTEAEVEVTDPIIGMSLDEDLRVDVIASDSDHDGFADIVVVDTDADGVMDVVGLDLDLDGDLDAIVVDEGIAGFDDNDPVYDINNEVHMDELIIIESVPDQKENLEEDEVAHDSNFDTPIDADIDLDADTIEI